MNKLVDKQREASSARNAGFPWLIYFGGSYAVSDYRAGAVHGFSVRCVAQYLWLFLFGSFRRFARHLRFFWICSFLETWMGRFTFFDPGGLCLSKAGISN